MTTKKDIKAQISWGIEQGIEQGREDEKREIARKMQSDGISTELICKYTGLSESVVTDL